MLGIYPIVTATCTEPGRGVRREPTPCRPACRAEYSASPDECSPSIDVDFPGADPQTAPDRTSPPPREVSDGTYGTEPGTADPAGCERPAPAGLCPAAVPADGRILELRHLLLHHFGPHRRRPSLRLRSQVRRADHQQCRLAARQHLHALRRGLDGRAGLGISDRGRT